MSSAKDDLLGSGVGGDAAAAAASGGDGRGSALARKWRVAAVLPLALIAAANFLLPARRGAACLPLASSSPRGSGRWSPSSEASSRPSIPHRFNFNFKHNLMEYPPANRELARNVNRTIRMFREAWNESEPDSPVAFFDDRDCEGIINATEPRLLWPFRNETRGSHKSDICRIAQLWQYGGYYFDNDIGVINVPQFPDHVSFVTVQESGFKSFFQAFTAAAPRHPVLTEALSVMADYYEGNLDPRSLGRGNGNAMGTWTLKEAYDRTVRNRTDLADHASILQEINLYDFPGWFPEVPRDPHWRHYNNAVYDPRAGRIYFWSRLGIDFRKREGLS